MVWPSQMTSRKMLAHDVSLPHMPASFKTPLTVWYRLLGTKWQHSWPCSQNVQTAIFRNQGEKMEKTKQKSCSVSSVYCTPIKKTCDASSILLLIIFSCLSYSAAKATGVCMPVVYRASVVVFLIHGTRCQVTPSPCQYLFTDSSALNKFNQTKPPEINDHEITKPVPTKEYTTI